MFLHSGLLPLAILKLIAIPVYHAVAVNSDTTFAAFWQHSRKGE